MNVEDLKHLYFAYGSNLSKRQMRDRCPEAVVICIGHLNDFGLSFTRFSVKRGGGVADVIGDVGNRVWGLIYKLSNSDLLLLDKHEGHPTIYKRSEKQINTETKMFSAWVYEVVDKKPVIEPSFEYLETITQSATELCFPKEYIESIRRFRSS